MNNSRTNYSPLKEGKRTFYSFSSNKSVPLPVITKMTFKAKPKLSNEKMKGKIISMKKELNTKNFELHELKLAHSKLENEKEENLKILDSVIIESKTTDKPIELNRSKSMKEMTITVNSYNKLKIANSISNLKRQIVLYQRLIKEKETEMKSLENESKVVKLIEKNNLLLSTVNKISALSDSCEMMEGEIKEKEKKAKEDKETRDYYKALYLNLKNDNEVIIEKYNGKKEEQNKNIEMISQQQEKFNSLKFQMNTIKQQEMQRDKEIASMTKKKNSIEDVKDELERTKEKIEKTDQLIKEIKEENEIMNKTMKEVEYEKDECSKKLQSKEKVRKKNKSNENGIRMNKEIESLNKEIEEIKKENYELKRTITEEQKKIETKNKKYINNAKEKSKKYEIVNNINFQLKLQSKHKTELIIQSMPNVITVKGNNLKGKGLETVPNKEEVPSILKQEEEPKIELVND